MPGRGRLFAILALLLSVLTVLLACGKKEDPLSALETWATAALTFGLDDLGGSDLLLEGWHAESLLDLAKSFSSSIRVGHTADGGYRVTLVCAADHDQRLYQIGLQETFIRCALANARRAYGAAGGKPPYPIAEFRIELYIRTSQSVTVEPATPYEPAKRTTVRGESLAYAATIIRDEVLRASDWSHFVTYCIRKPDFFFGQVCRDVHQ